MHNNVGTKNRVLTAAAAAAAGEHLLAPLFESRVRW